MSDPLKWNDLHGKAQGAGIGGAFGILVVIIVEATTSIDALAAGVLVGVTSTIFSYLLPEVPPWKKNG